MAAADEMYVIPPIGSKGSFRFKPPFNTPKYEEIELTVTAIRSLKELADGGIQPYEIIYRLSGLTEEDFKEDVTKNIPIIVLATTAGQYVYIPADRVTSLPDITGYKYQECLLAINLGLMPVDANLETVKEIIVNSVQDNIGVTSDVKQIRSSAVILVTPDKHKEFQTRLANRKQNSTSFKTKYQKATEELAAVKKQLADLEKYVTANLN